MWRVTLRSGRRATACGLRTRLSEYARHAMSALRESMEAELKSVFVPQLRAASLNGSFPKFRRLVEEGIDLLSFQFDRNGGGFVIETQPTVAAEVRRQPSESLSHDFPRGAAHRSPRLRALR